MNLETTSRSDICTQISRQAAVAVVQRREVVHLSAAVVELALAADVEDGLLVVLEASAVTLAQGAAARCHHLS